MSLGEHLDELRRRIIYALLGLAAAVGVSLFFGRELIALLKAPYLKVLQELGKEYKPAVFTVADGFLTYFRVGLLAGLVAASPWIFYQVWRFVASGLKPREQKYVYWAVPASAGLFIAGAVFFLTVVTYPMLRFFMHFNILLDAEPVIRLRTLVAFMTNLMLVFGLAFQTPIVVLVLGKMGLVSTRTLGKYRRHVIVAMLILAALVTSPSPIDQVALALPMWLLYELGILLVRLFASEKRK